ncbi:hypothetical protein HDU98_010653 [Podochytrium sp. JEL0797]|nr:hypothetical protein HDU98_010653 [Podochytrium sp. JEL0797]
MIAHTAKQELVTTLLHTLQTEISSAIASHSTPAAIRMSQALQTLGPLSVSLRSNTNKLAAFHLFQDTFQTETLNLTIGRPVGLKSGSPDLFPFHNPTSIVVLAGSTAIATVLTSLPHYEPLKPDDTTAIHPNWDDRLMPMFRYMDSLALPRFRATHGASSSPFSGHALELMICATHADFRGSLAGHAVGAPSLSTPANPHTDPKFSLFQRVQFVVERLVALHGYTGLYSHSNDSSATKQRELGGWETVVEVQCDEVPRNIAVSPVKDGHLCFLYKKL